MRKRTVTNRWGVTIHVGDSFKVHSARGGTEGPFTVAKLETTGDFVKAYGKRVVFDNGLSAGIDDLIVHAQSYKKNPRPRIGAAKPGRPSSATGKRPTKRLVSRRKKNLRKGYFPNPRKTVYVVQIYSGQHGNLGNHRRAAWRDLVILNDSTLAYAQARARSEATKHRSNAIRLIKRTVDNWRDGL